MSLSPSFLSAAANFLKQASLIKTQCGNSRTSDSLTVAMLGLTMIGVFWQVHEMIEAYGPIRDQAIATGESAEATGRAADAATKSAEGGEKSLVLSQRAWVGPSNASRLLKNQVLRVIFLDICGANNRRDG
jgi:hypothetical protein